MPAQQWVHVALVKSGNSWRLLMNGAVAATANLQYNAPDIPFVMGGVLGNPDWALKGAMSELIFYNRALTDTEIRVLSN